MDNDERIQRWRQERGSRVSKPPLPAEDPLDDALGARSRERAETRVSSEALNRDAPQLPDDVSLEEARLAIIERRRTRWRQLIRRFLLFVGLPLLAILLYAAL